MDRPLRAILVVLLLFAILLQSSDQFTGAATTQSFVTIMAPAQPTPGPSAPSGAVPAAAPGVPETPTVLQIPTKIFYIGNFALNNKYTVWMGVGETWIYTYKGENHTLKEVFVDGDYAEFELQSSLLHLKIYKNQTVQVDSDNNGYSDVRITVNSIENQKANVTLEILSETVLFEEIKSSNLVYVILGLLALLFIDTLIHHTKERQIFKHFKGKK